MQLEQSGERSMEESLRCEREDLQDEVDRLKAGLMASKERESLLQAETEAFELQVSTVCVGGEGEYHIIQFPRVDS